jgi:hypothetical protein
MAFPERAHVAPLKNVGRLDCGVRVLAGIWVTAHAVEAVDRPFLAIAWAAVGLFILDRSPPVCPVYTLIGTLRPRAAQRPRPNSRAFGPGAIPPFVSLRCASALRP